MLSTLLGSPAALRAADGAYTIAATWPDGGPGLPADAWPAASGVAIDRSKRIYVADAVTARVSVVEPSGLVRWLYEPGRDPGLVEPHDLAVDDARQRVYVADRGARAIVVLGFDGARLATWGGLTALAGVGVGPDGTVFAGAADSGEVRRFTPDGAPLAAWRAVRDAGPGASGLIVNLDVAGSDGTLAVLAAGPPPRMLLFDKQGRRLDPVDLPPAIGEVSDVVADHSVGLGTRRWYWFATERGLAFYDPLRDVWSLNAVARLTTLAVHPPLGIAATAPGAERQPSKVHRFAYGLDAQSGPPAQSWGVPIDVAGQVDGPTTVEIGADGRVYVLDRAPRVQAFTPDGTAIGQLSLGGVGAVDAGPDGTVYVAHGSNVGAYALGGARRWQAAIGARGDGSAIALAYDNAARQVVALDAVAGRLNRFTLDGAAAGGVALPGDPDSRAIWADLAVDAAGNAYALDRLLGAVTRVAPDGTARPQVAGAGGRRVAARPDGIALTLGRDGWVRGYDAGGSRLFAFDARRPDLTPATSPADLAVDAGGDVYVADRTADVITRWRWDPAATPAPPPESQATCDAGADKVATPAEVRLGESVEVRLAVRGRCGAQVATVPLDVLLIVDRSGSMAGERIRIARDAAMDFVAEADLGVSRVGIVSFNDSAAVDAPLTSDEVALRRAIDKLTAFGGTRIDVALATANAELARSGRPGAAPVFILLSDGGSDPAAALREADLAKREGVEIFTIGIEGNSALLSAIASGADHFFEAEGARQLFAIFDRIAERIVVAALFRTLDVVDELPANMRLVPGSMEPAGSWDPGARLLRWHVEGVPFDGTTLRYRLEPLEAGEWPANVAAWGDYVDGYHNPGRLEFPVPRVRVLAPTATPTVAPTATPTGRPSATPTVTLTATRAPPTARPRPVFLPLALRERCRPGQRHTDVMLVIDTSNSMAGANLDGARAAARRFVGLLSLPADQAGVVTFNLQARLASRLSGSLGSVEAALADLGPTQPGTRIDRGLARARLELQSARSRPASAPVVVLLTDGIQNDAPETAIAAAEASRGAGIRVYAIGLGGDVDAGFLGVLAGDRSQVFLAPGPTDLAGIYAQVAGELPCPRAAFWGGR